jgi:hypothetical protein
LKEQIFSNRGKASEMLTMWQKMAVTGELQDSYQKSKKREKIIILNEFTKLTSPIVNGLIGDPASLSWIW